MFAVILAGGKGERFWPLSREKRPKQFLSLTGESSMLELTLERVKRFVPEENVVVVATEILREYLENMDLNVIYEPKGMNTLYAVALGAFWVKKRDPEGVMCVLPSDHWVGDVDAWVETMKKGEESAKEGYLVTFGVTPTRPETGYGYIEMGKEIKDGVYEVKRFTEKPNFKQALEFLKKGNFLWNSGMFEWRADVILEEIKENMPDIREEVEREDVEGMYTKGKPISIDYGVMEHSKRVRVVRATFPWDDVGNWGALERINPKDENGNVVVGRWAGKDTRECIIYAKDGVVGVMGIEDAVVVHTPDATLVMKKKYAQEVKELLSMLRERGWKEYL